VDKRGGGGGSTLRCVKSLPPFTASEKKSVKIHSEKERLCPIHLGGNIPTAGGPAASTVYHRALYLFSVFSVVHSCSVLHQPTVSVFAVKVSGVWTVH
jgi:hypothetical protein